jgi:TusA-related sulfurtransferase
VSEDRGWLATATPDFFGVVAREPDACYDGLADGTTMTDQTKQDGGANRVTPDAELDLRGVICPYNFVKTKLKLETMQAGQVLAVMLDDGDPIRNVPRSVSDDGHAVLGQDPMENFYRVLIRKRVDR